jgi:hypothetical protein
MNYGEPVESLANCLRETRTALEVIRQNDAYWFPGTSGSQYAEMCENS